MDLAVAAVVVVVVVPQVSLSKKSIIDYSLLFCQIWRRFI